MTSAIVRAGAPPSCSCTASAFGPESFDARGARSARRSPLRGRARSARLRTACGRADGTSLASRSNDIVATIDRARESIARSSSGVSGGATHRAASCARGTRLGCSACVAPRTAASGRWPRASTRRFRRMRRRLAAAPARPSAMEVRSRAVTGRRDLATPWRRGPRPASARAAAMAGRGRRRSPPSIRPIRGALRARHARARHRRSGASGPERHDAAADPRAALPMPRCRRCPGPAHAVAARRPRGVRRRHRSWQHAPSEVVR